MQIENYLTPEFLYKIESRKVEFIYSATRSVITKLTGISNETIEVTFEQKRTIIGYNKVAREVRRAVNKSLEPKNSYIKKYFPSTKFKKNYLKWQREEEITKISSEINKLFDKVCIDFHVSLDNKKKEVIMKKVADSMGIKLNLDLKCVQPSLNHVIGSSKYVLEKVRELSSKNTIEIIMPAVVSELADQVYTRQYKGIDLSKLKEITLAAIESHFILVRNDPLIEITHL